MAKVETISHSKLLSAEQALDNLFRALNSPEVETELRKWLQFGLTGEGHTLHTLSPEQLALFLDKIPDLALAIYCQQSEGQKGDGHEP